MAARNRADGVRTSSEAMVNLTNRDDDDDLSVSSMTSLSESLTDRVASATGASSTRGHPYSVEEWIARAHMRNGIPLDSLAGDVAHLRFSHREVAMASSIISVERTLVADTVISSTTSVTGAALMRLGFSKPSAKRMIPWLSFMDEPAIAQPSTIRVVAKQAYTRVVVHTTLADLTPQPDFVLDVESVFRAQASTQLQALRDVLGRWGPMIATQVELGCSLVSSTMFEIPCSIPAASYFPNKTDFIDSSAFNVAEETVRNVIQKITTGNAPGTTQQERDAYASMASGMTFRAVGGTTRMHMDRRVDQESVERPDVWAITSIGGVHPVLELLRRNHTELYDRVRALIANARPREEAFGGYKSNVPWPYVN